MDTSDLSRPGAEATPAEPSAEAPAQAPAQAPSEVSAEPPAETPARRRRPRGLTTLIVACGALVGVVGGTATGYAVQAEREPTPLPPLSQADLAYPEKALPESKRPAPLPAKHDTAVKANGDLRKLLVGKPEGARVWSTGIHREGAPVRDGWLSPGEFSLEYGSPAYQLEDLLDGEVRRVAAANWLRGKQMIAVRLVQFRPGALAAAAASDRESQGWAAARSAPGEESGWSVRPGSSARYHLTAPEPGAWYWASASGFRGDVWFTMDIFDESPIPRSTIRDLARAQLDRL
ncbi:hypothetical protein [Streptomyces albidoflavus]|uniref:hypothetical protein n=1 Tax=Streptomyces albidoflavus TaxID=1886 RepID=UPI00101E531A|nr:hypothetical protein [Streptomyces albidoflavus]RZE92922.1 hypothetical protein C0R04_17345 [Streptomyces albidoflavus]RZE94112.1 hypothetical protein C0R03_17365 [Streptomyces albidoflavus]